MSPLTIDQTILYVYSCIGLPSSKHKHKSYKVIKMLLYLWPEFIFLRHCTSRYTDTVISKTTSLKIEDSTFYCMSCQYIASRLLLYSQILDRKHFCLYTMSKIVWGEIPLSLCTPYCMYCIMLLHLSEIR